MFTNTTVYLNALCNSCTKIAYSSSELIFTFPYADNNIQISGEEFLWCIHFSAVSFALLPNPQTQIKRS